jgi:isocitrate dehydrogenase (NAD+)
LNTRRREGRKKVTAVHKANIMKMSDGLFLTCCRESAAQFPEIQYTELIVDNCCMQLVMRPETFDLLVLPNLYGDIVLGPDGRPGRWIGDRARREPGRDLRGLRGRARTAPDIVGKGLANPTALMQSAVLMLAHIGEREASKSFRRRFTPSTPKASISRATSAVPRPRSSSPKRSSAIYS